MVEIVLWILAFIVGSLSAGRLTRLLVQDSFPPAVWLRTKWLDKFDDTQWGVLFECHWCMSFWMTLPIGLWGWLSNLHASWWVVNGILAATYVSAIIVERDEKE